MTPTTTSDSTARDAKPLGSSCLLQAIGLNKSYTADDRWKSSKRIKALDNVDIDLRRGETTAVVGKSGSGKSTLAMCLALLEPPDSGEVVFEGCKTSRLDRKTRREVRRSIQVIFQSSATALSPRLTVEQLVEEPLKIQNVDPRSDRQQVVRRCLGQVALGQEFHSRRPHELSGGQRQRVAIARSLTLGPSLLILDEPFVGLDAPIRNQIVNLLLDLQETNNLTYLYISHDVDLVRCFADTTLTMNHGKLTAWEDLRACSN